jgi:hypothetical protein
MRAYGERDTKMQKKAQVFLKRKGKKSTRKTDMLKDNIKTNLKEIIREHCTLFMSLITIIQKRTFVNTVMNVSDS